MADPGGTWNINTGSLSAGTHNLTATATDAAGNVSNISNVLDPIVGPVLGVTMSYFYFPTGPLAGNDTNSTFTRSSDGHGSTVAIDPPKDSFDFASTPSPHVPTLPSVTVGGAGNDAFVFHQPAVGNSGSPDNFALDLFGSNLEGKHSIALVNGGQSDHQWMDVAQHTGFGHLDSINPVNAHFSAPHGDFLIH